MNKTLVCNHDDLAGFEQQLNEAYRKWQARKQICESFSRLPKWAYWLLGGHMVHGFLVFRQEMAEDTFWEIEIQQH